MSIATFSTCEISDALIKLGLPSGGHLSDIQPLVLSNPSAKICGPAYTVQMVLASNESAPRLSAHFVDTAPEGTVVVIDAPSRSVSDLTSTYLILIGILPYPRNIQMLEMLYGVA